MVTRSIFGSTAKTAVLLAALIGLFVLVGRLVAGPTGLVFGLGLGILMTFGTYWFSDKVVMRMGGAREVSEREAPELYRIIRQLTQRAGLPMPKVAIVNDPTPNAFATGRNPKHAVIAVHTGLLNMLSYDELAGVLAHELSHVKHYDTLISAIAATVAGTISFVGQMFQWSMWFGGFGGGDDDEGGGNMVAALVLALLAPIAALIIQLAISRSREYAADAGAAGLTGEPLALASALRKLEYGAQAMPVRNVNPAMASLYISNPFEGKGRGMMNMFSTHPPVDERIARLEALAVQARRGRLA